MFNKFKDIKCKFLEMRNYNKSKYVEYNYSLTVICKNYVGALWLTVITLLAICYFWGASTKGWSFIAFQMIIPSVIIVSTFLINGVFVIIYLILDVFSYFCNGCEKYLEQKYILKFYQIFIEPITAAIDGNIFSFIFGNILVLLSLYNSSWKDLIQQWENQSRNGIIYGSILFIIAGVVIPILFAFVNSFVTTVFRNDIE